MSAESRPAAAPPACDALVLGAGPAGASCALWLAEYGLRCVLADKAPQACSTLDALRFPQDWVLGEPGRTLAEIASGYRAHLAQRRDIDTRFGTRLLAARHDAAGWHLQLGPAGGEAAPAEAAGGAGAAAGQPAAALTARAIVLATGVSPRRPPAYFNAALAGSDLVDAVGLTQRRESWAGRRVLLLGGGDNAAENALALAALGSQVVLANRSPLRAQRRFLRQLEQQALAAPARLQCRAPTPLPELQRDAAGRLQARWPTTAPGPWAGTEEAYDGVAVLFGFQPNLQPLEMLRSAQGLPANNTLPPGVFLAGDAAERLHPCVPTALGDGAHTAHEVERWLAGG